MHFSVVIPIYNEELNILPLFQDLEKSMNALQKPWEVIFVDDGSTDKSATIIRNLSEINSAVKLLSFQKNAGQTAAFDAGFKKAAGTYIITLDGDGQNSPHDIAKMTPFLDEGFDLVAGKRQVRRDSFAKKIISRSANFVRQRLLQDGIQDTGCSLKIFRASILAKFSLYKGMHRFFPALVLIHGGRVKEVEVTHHPRLTGTSKYSLFSRGPSLIVDMLAVSWMRKRKLHYEIKNG